MQKDNEGYPVIDKASLESLLRLQCTRQEVISFYGSSKTALIRWIKKNYDGKTFEELQQQFALQGQVSLRRKAFQMAEKQPSVMIFLLKSVCHLSEEPAAQQDPSAEKNVSAFNDAIKTAARAITDCAGLVAGLPSKNPPEGEEQQPQEATSADS
jgi:hypothetical protein